VPPKNILVVDDDEGVRRFLCRLLEQSGFATDEAPGGEIALAKIAAARPDLVSLDLSMPGLDGWDVIDRLRTFTDAPPVLLLTALLEGDDRGPLRPPVAGLAHKADDPRIYIEACRRILQGLPDDDAEAPGAERRRRRRLPLVVPARISASNGGMALGEGRLVRVSPIGADLESQVALAQSKVVLSIPVPGREAPIALEAQLYPRQRTAYGLLYGVSFLSPPPDVQKLLDRMLED
jgi:CheY-like chemotaxis protein